MPKSVHPPKFSLRLIRWLCKEELVEELQGDLEEYYFENQDSNFSKLKYWVQVLNYLRLSTLKSVKTQKSSPMFVFNPIVTLRSLSRHKSSTIISILGFTVGLVASIMLYFYIYSELTTDSFHADGDRIFRVIRKSEVNATPYKIGVTSGPFAKALKNDFPSAITSATRVLNESGLISVGDKKFFENRIIMADANFFEFFSYPLLQGDPKMVLTKPNSAVISKEMAIKYFGNENPIGKEIKADNMFTFIVSGVMDDLPAKTHINFDFVASIETYEQFDWFKDWWNNNLMTYVKLSSPQVAENVDNQLSGFMEKYFGEDFKRTGFPIGLTLEPLKDIYFNHDTRYDPALHGNFNAVITLVLVSIAILFIACFNYVNLSIAQSFLRTKEVGIRKVLGVQKGRLVLQFLGESSLIILFSIGISIGLCYSIAPTFQMFFDLDLNINWWSPQLGIFILVILMVILVTSGVYPAVLITSFKPVAILKGKLDSGKKAYLRKGLVVLQFCISIFLIIATALISIQNSYLNNKSLGFDKEAIAVIRLYNQEIRQNKGTFIKELQANPHVKSVSNTSGEPGGFHDVTVFHVAGVEGDFRFRTVFCDTSYINVFDIDVMEGSNFNSAIQTEALNGMLINEKALAELGIPAHEAIGKNVKLPSWNGLERKIIGVVKDYHFTSLKDEIEPLAIIAGENFGGRLAVKLDGRDLKNAIISIDEIYRELSPGFPLQYDFLDDKLARLYEEERIQARLFSVFSGISIFLACLGIFGLAAYASQRRQKELGIRKILGANIIELLSLISKEFLLLVGLASIVAFPVCFYFMNNWLKAFAYRIQVMDFWYIFILGGILAVLIALVTVILKTRQSAIANPTESIRNE